MVGVIEFLRRYTILRKFMFSKRRVLIYIRYIFA